MHTPHTQLAKEGQRHPSLLAVADRMLRRVPPVYMAAMLGFASGTVFGLFASSTIGFIGYGVALAGVFLINIAIMVWDARVLRQHQAISRSLEESADAVSQSIDRLTEMQPRKEN